MKIGVTHNLGAAPADIRRIPGQGASALSEAMNTTVRRAQFDVIAEMRNVFDRPTPYTLNGLRTDFASAARLQARLMVKGKRDAGGGAVPAESYLRAEIDGGTRHDKRSEILLRRVAALPAGWVSRPGDGARLDGFGNMSRGQIVQIISYFEAFPEDGYRANSTQASRLKKATGTKRRSGFTYFAVPPGNKGLAPGIWERRGYGPWANAGVRCVIKFVKVVRYRSRLEFFVIAKRAIDTNLGAQFDREFAKATAA